MMRRLPAIPGDPPAAFRAFRACTARWPGVPLAVLLLAVAPHVAARGLDQSFATYGTELSGWSDGDGGVVAHVPRPGGGSVAVYAYRDFNFCPVGKWCLMLTWFRDDGPLEASAYVPVSVHFDEVAAAAIDSQERIVVVGSRMISGTDYDFQIARVTAAGDRDTAFAAGGVASVPFDLPGSSWEDKATAVAIDRSDRIVIVGRAAAAPAGDFRFAVARLTSAGVRDLSFETSTIPFDIIPGRSLAIASAVAIDGADRIVVAGQVADPTTLHVRMGVARLRPNGSYDTTWCSPSCGYGNAYPAINSGRSVPFYGTVGQVHIHVVAALAVTSAGHVALAGDYDAPGGFTGFALTLDPDGNWWAERKITGGSGAAAADTEIGGVAFVSPANADSDLVVTGVKKVDGGGGTYFFAQCLQNDQGLPPRAGWGNDPSDGQGASTIRFASGLSGGNPDPPGTRPRPTAIDRKGRVLTGGDVPHQGRGVALTVRLEGDLLFRDGFD